jgi:hypothetical protein
MSSQRFQVSTNPRRFLVSPNVHRSPELRSMMERQESCWRWRPRMRHWKWVRYNFSGCSPGAATQSCTHSQAWRTDTIAAVHPPDSFTLVARP